MINDKAQKSNEEWLFQSVQIYVQLRTDIDNKGPKERVEEYHKYWKN